MSERSRRPDGSSGPSTTDRSNPSGGDDFYAAAAASAAGRNAKSAGSAGQGGNGGAGSSENGSSPAPVAPASGDQPSGGPAAALGSAAGQVINAVRPSKPGRKQAAPKATPGPPAQPVAPSESDTQRVAPLVGPSAQTAETAAQPTTASPGQELEQLQPAAVDKKAAKKADKAKAGSPRGTRKARLRLSRLDPWSVMKTSFMFSIAAGIVMVVAVYAVWLVIGSSGLFGSIDSIVGSVLQSPGDTTPFRIEDYVNTQKVMGVTAFLACIDVVIFTALATLASFLYNLAATMLGGLEVTLAED